MGCPWALLSGVGAPQSIKELVFDGDGSTLASRDVMALDGIRYVMFLRRSHVTLRLFLQLISLICRVSEFVGSGRCRGCRVDRDQGAGERFWISSPAGLLLEFGTCGGVPFARSRANDLCY